MEFFTKASSICFMGDRRIVRTVVIWEASQSCCARSASCSGRARFRGWCIVSIRVTLAQLQRIVSLLRFWQAIWPSLPWIHRSIAHAVWSACCSSGTDDYFVGKVVKARAFTPGSVEARFYELLMRAGPVDYDDRKSAIEVQVNQAISLRDQLLFVVLPRRILGGGSHSRCHYQCLELRSSGVCYVQGRRPSLLLLRRAREGERTF